MNEEKYIATIQYLLDNQTGANNEHLGKVKLMKLLYYADFDHFAKYGHPITGDTYRKLQHGPVPKNADHMLDLMRSRELLKIKNEQVIDFVQYRYELAHPVSDAELGSLTEEEKATLGEVVAKWRNHTREGIVAATHGEPPWLMSKLGEEIPYDTVHYRRNVGSRDDEEHEPMPIGPSPYWRSS